MKPPFYLLVGIFFCITACKTDPQSEKTTQVTASVNHSAVAEGYCSCMQPLIDANKEILALMQAGDKAQVEAMMFKVEKLSDASEKCVEKLEGTQQPWTVADEQQIEKEMLKVCPETARIVLNERDRSAH